jgi:hypothetical protein
LDAGGWLDQLPEFGNGLSEQQASLEVCALHVIEQAVYLVKNFGLPRFIWFDFDFTRKCKRESFNFTLSGFGFLAGFTLKSGHNRTASHFSGVLASEVWGFCGRVEHGWFIVQNWWKVKCPIFRRASGGPWKRLTMATLRWLTK